MVVNQARSGIAANLAQSWEFAYWWRGRLYRESEAPRLAVPVKLFEVEVVEWVCPKCGGKADWAPEPKCPVCGARCQPRSSKEVLPELPDAAEALERVLERVCGEAVFRGAVVLDPPGTFQPLFAWKSLDAELPDGSRLIGAHAGKARFLRRGLGARRLAVFDTPSERFFELPGNLCLVVWRAGFIECFAFEVPEPERAVELLEAEAPSGDRAPLKL